MPHAVLLLGATFLATAAATQVADHKNSASAQAQPVPIHQTFEQQRIPIIGTAEVETLRPVAPQRWVF